MTVKSPCSIVTLTLSNRTLLDHIADGVFDYEIRADQLDIFLDCPRHSMQLAVVGNVVVGMLSAVEYFHPDKDRQLWINEVGVAPPFQSQGIGKKLVATALERARESGCVAAWLGTDVDNLAAQKCFRSVGKPPNSSEFMLLEWALTDENSTSQRESR